MRGAPPHCPRWQRTRRLGVCCALVLIVVAGLLGSCATAPASREDKAALVAAVTTRLQQMSKEVTPLTPREPWLSF
jgi:hypothetical protein